MSNKSNKNHRHQLKLISGSGCRLNQICSAMVAQIKDAKSNVLPGLSQLTNGNYVDGFSYEKKFGNISLSCEDDDDGIIDLESIDSESTDYRMHAECIDRHHYCDDNGDGDAGGINDVDLNFSFTIDGSIEECSDRMIQRLSALINRLDNMKGDIQQMIDFLANAMLGNGELVRKSEQFEKFIDYRNSLLSRNSKTEL